MKENRLARLTDLSRAFDCLLHDHLLAKLHPYGFRLSALKLIHSYLKNRKRRATIDSTYCSWDEILLWVPQGSILGPLLINIFLSNLLYSIKQNLQIMLMTPNHVLLVICYWY